METEIKAEVEDKNHRAKFKKNELSFSLTGWYPQRRILGFFWRDMTPTPYTTMRQAEQHYTGKSNIKLKK